MKKAYGYIDGFNLYYRALKGTAYRWLNPVALCEELLPDLDFIKVKYFTALVRNTPDDQFQRQRQKNYLNAIDTIQQIEIYKGTFTKHKKWLRKVSDEQKVQVWKPEEKGSDVNLASHLLIDAFNNRYDTAVIITGDTDFITPISIINKNLKKEAVILCPQKKLSQRLQQVVTKYLYIYGGHLKKSQLEDIITHQGKQIKKPPEWDHP